ncbi:MAG: hypothetical protein GY851_05030 [bacterium]|nr:hypothetical protein [bacterium]
MIEKRYGLFNRFVFSVLCILVAAGADAATDLTLTIDTASGFPGGPAQVGVDLAATTRPATIQFQILYDDDDVTPINVTAGEVVLQANKQAAWSVPEEGTLTVLVSGQSGAGITTTVADGRLVTVLFAVDSDVSVGETIPLTGGLVTAATPAPVPIDSSIVDGEIQVGACTAPDPPTNLSATPGLLTDRVRLSWIASPKATAYDVYRSTVNDSSTATFLGSLEWSTLYDDFGAAAAAWVVAGGGGCGGGSGGSVKYTNYYYWVVARNGCGTSGFGSPVTGFRGYAKAASQQPAVVNALPDTSRGRDIGLDISLALLLESDEPIDPATIWGQVESDVLQSGAVTWLPAHDNAVWVRYDPETQWLPGELVVMTAGATTVSGAPVGPARHVYRVADAAKADVVEPGVPQPKAGQSAGAAVEVVESLDPETPAGPLEGLGPVYRIGPAGPYDAPRLVWLPVPEGHAPADLDVYFYNGPLVGGAWYHARSVAGWLADETFLADERNGIGYVGLWIRHGGLVQIGTAEFAPPPAMTSANVFGMTSTVPGDLLLAGVAMAGFVLARRRIRRDA